MSQFPEVLETGASFLSQSDALEEGLRLGGAGIWRWKIGSDELHWTRNLESVHHLPPGSFNGTLSSFQSDIHPDDVDGVWQKIRSSVETGAPYRAVYRTAPRPDKAELWIETAGGTTIDAAGTRYLTGICLDVTERVRSEQQLQRRLTQQHAVARFGSYALNQPELQKVLDEAARVAAEVLDVPLTKILQFADDADHLVLRAGIGWADGLVGHGTVGIERASQAGYTLLAQAPVIVKDLLNEERFTGPALLHDHNVRSGISVVIPGLQKRPYGVFGAHTRDVRNFDDADAEFLQSLANVIAGAARQAAAADHRMLLVREMAHRAGNMLQLVTSIARQTFHPEVDIQHAKRSFSERLKALAQSNYVVARSGWIETSFAELIEEALKPFGERVQSNGRDVLLPPELCFDLGLVLHELTTNSVKYGTLGCDEGAVRVEWAFRSQSEGLRVFWFHWEDQRSAPQGHASAGTGFGSKLVLALVEKKWRGAVKYADSSHFAVTLEIPVDGAVSSSALRGFT
ncbi:MAG: GAF domain-containing protein [Rhizobiaceae bacterium]|nr:GAF domain-containing protein [Rhizobiaceae bacterium]MCV0406869.1 GAF domain-containing protein [Rhizobiaceae bacterium]